MIKEKVICYNCGNDFIEDSNTKDVGICSLQCGYEIRGLSEWDFVVLPDNITIADDEFIELVSDDN